MANLTKRTLRSSRLLALVVALALLIASCTGEDETPHSTSTPTIPQGLTDREVLIALYEATDGPNWTNNTNWLTNKPLGEWYNVTTNANNSVIGLSLTNNYLTGEIPPELSDLSKLGSVVTQLQQFVWRDST